MLVIYADDSTYLSFKSVVGLLTRSYQRLVCCPCMQCMSAPRQHLTYPQCGLWVVNNNYLSFLSSLSFFNRFK